MVSLRPPPDAVDYLGHFDGIEIDYTSHELAAALRLLLKGNGNILERILSPFQLVDGGARDELQRLARAAVCRKFFHHYRGFFGRMCLDWRRSEPKTVKGLLYAYRSALTGIHLLLTGECVGDVTVLAPQYGFPAVWDLVARKASGPEHGELAAADVREGDLERLEALLQTAHHDSRLPLEAGNAGALDAFLIRARCDRLGAAR